MVVEGDGAVGAAFAGAGVLHIDVQIAGVFVVGSERELAVDRVAVLDQGQMRCESRTQAS